MKPDEFTRWTSRRSPDAGNAIVEFTLWLPLVIIVLASCLQLMGMLYEQRAAEAAAKVALRAQQAGDDPAAAARVALAGRGNEAIVIAIDGTIRVQLPVRKYLPLLPKKFTEATGQATSKGSTP